MKTISSLDLRKDLTRVLTDAQHGAEETVSTRSRNPIAVLLGKDRWEEIQSILATWDQMRDPENKNKLRAATGPVGFYASAIVVHPAGTFVYVTSTRGVAS